MKSRTSIRHFIFLCAMRGAIGAADGLRRTWPVALLCLAMLAGGALWLASAASARTWVWRSCERLFGSAAQNAGWANPRAQPNATGTSTLDIVPFDDPGAGVSTFEGTIGTAINTSGDVAGMYSNSVGAVHGFVRTAGRVFTNFDAPGAGASPPTGKVQGTIPTAIDTTGNVTGVYIDANNAYHGFLRTADGTITEFDAPGASSAANRGTSPMAMNDAGEIVGFYTTGDLNSNSVYHGFVRAANGAIATIDAPGAGSGESPIGRKQGTSPSAINASGEIAGTYVDSNNNRHGFVLSTSGTFTSFDPPGSTTSTGSGGGMSGTGVTGIDTAGDVVGGYTDSNLVRHGYVRSAGGAITTFDVPGANTTSASGSLGGTYPIGIDPGGNYIVGIYADSNGLDHGFAYLQPLTGSGTFTSITAPNAGATATPPISGTGAGGVNASGEVVGGYLDSNDVGHGFVLTLTTQAVAATPTFSPSGGTYSSALSVTITDTTPGATIYYTTDGTTPTTSSSAYSGPVTVYSSETIEAIATASGYNQSAVATAAYVINLPPVTPTPTFSPQGGVYPSTQTVTISDTNSGAKIYYTTDGTTPTTASALYINPITVSSSETIEAIAVASGYVQSDPVTAEYVISSGNQGQFTTLFNFNGNNGAHPSQGALIQGLDGNFYGTTSQGGVTGHGTVFKVTPAGVLSTMYSFCPQTGCADGSGPGNTLVLGANQVMYGTTSAGGTNQCTFGTQTQGCGTIFQIGPGGALSTLHNFAGSDGAVPTGPLVAGADGNLYGTTVAGGANNTGTIFRLTPGGNLTTPYSFCSQNSCGAGPSPVIQGADGNFYGASTYTVFEVTPQGTETALASMGGTLGYGVWAPLVQAANGNFYGVAYYGGNSGNVTSCHGAGGAGFGTIFSIAPGGQETTLYSFQNSLDGAGPEAALIQATDGNLYGTTACGGTGEGAIFSISPAGAFTPLHSFAPPNAYGGSSQGGLVQGTDGSFYGTTPFTGPDNEGTIFNFSLGLSPFVKTIPTSGGVGSVVQIMGNNLTGSTAVSFNGTAAQFTLVSGSNIQATVPAGAITGTVTVTTANKTLSSNLPFQVTTQAATPTFSPASGTYSSPQTVTISDGTAGAAVYYTTEGTPPTMNSTQYTGPITVSSSQTIAAIATATGYATSAVGSATYTFGTPIAATPTFSIAPGTYTSVQNVAISDATPGATIYYTVDGTTPTTSTTVYSGPITVSTTETIEAIAIANGYAASAVASTTYTMFVPSFGAPPNSPPIVISIDPGATTGNTGTISVVGINGFSGTVNLNCSISPLADTDPPTCSLSPASVTLSGTTVKTSTLTVSTTAPSSADSWPPWRHAGGIAFALVLLLAVPRRRSWPAMLILLAMIFSAGVLGCGSIGAGHRARFSGTTPGSYTITVTGTSGSTSATITTVTLMVK